MTPQEEEQLTLGCFTFICIVIIFILGAMLPNRSNAQCEGDVCTDAITLNLCGSQPGDVVCVPYKLCNGFYNGIATVPFCQDENGGNPDGCSSSTSTEYDFWVKLQICDEWVYTINFDSDYFHYQLDQVDGGAQMWIYDDCGNLNMIETALCDLEQAQNVWIDVYLEPGEYYVQVDGFGQSVGCGTFCVYRQGFLGLGVEELTRYNKQGQRIIFNALGQRVR